MKLYEYMNTRAARCHWVLQELGVPFQPVSVDLGKGEHRQEWFLKLNPFGKVPVLVMDDVTISESAAICMFLADRYPQSRLAPPLDTAARAKYYQWISYCVNELDPLLWTIKKHRDLYGPARSIPGIVDLATEELLERLPVLEAQVADRNHIVNDTFSVADILLCQTLIWSNFYDLLGDFPRLQSYAVELIDRPAFPRNLYDSEKFRSSFLQ